MNYGSCGKIIIVPAFPGFNIYYMFHLFTGLKEWYMKCAPSSMNGMLSHCPIFSVIALSNPPDPLQELDEEAEYEYFSQAEAEEEPRW